MATEKNKFEKAVAIFKDTLSALRDGLLFVVFLLLFFTPAKVNQRLKEAGFTKGSIAGFEWQAKLKEAAEQTKSVGQSVGQATEEYGRLIDRLKELENKVSDPSFKAEMKNIGVSAEESRMNLETADRTLKRSLATQQQVVAEVAFSSVVESGWMFLGKVTEDKTAWSSGSPKTILSSPSPPPPGTALIVRDDAYLRGDSPSNSRASAPILGVVKIGEALKVIEVDFSHAKSGGWFVWAKVRRN